jgi:hypothetical protein
MSQEYAEFDGLACQDEFYVNNPRDVKEKDEYVVDFALHLSRNFRSRRVPTFRVWLMLSSLNACLNIVRVSVTLFQRLVQNLMQFLCWIHHKITLDQIRDSK